MTNKPYALTPEKIKQAVEIVRKKRGVTIAQVARQYNISRQALSYHCKKAGVKPRPVALENRNQ